MLWGRKEHEVEISMLAYGRGATESWALPVSSESLAERGHRAGWRAAASEVRTDAHSYS